VQFTDSNKSHPSNQFLNELRQVKEKYQTLFLEARDGVALIDIHSGIAVDCNPEFQRQCGRDLKRLKATPIYAMFPNQHIDLGKILFRPNESEILQPDGTIIPVEFFAKMIQINHVDYLYLTVRDISERKQMEALNNASNKRFRQLFESMQEGCYLAKLIFDAQGNAVDWRYLESNPIHAQTLGLKHEDIIGKTLKQLLPNVDDFWFKTAIHTALSGESHVISGFESSSARYYECHYYSPCYAQVACIFSDITERRRSEQENKEADQKLRKAFEDLIHALTVSLESRDPYTAGHQKRVANLAVAIAKKMGLSNEDTQGIYFGGLLHDIGKIAIPSQILNKPGKISNIEYMLIKEHSQTGFDIIKNIDFPWPVGQIILQHHEKIDGSGYPHGLMGDEVLLEAKILTVSDVVEAMYSHRPYRPGLGVDKALAEIQQGRTRHYDPEVVDACTALFNDPSADIYTLLN
jgi:putative nucleotidyltransferase with HDIG domain/PAS domain S-box-containing protein